jgi:protein-S-isoprenylcysteine O-methyltransferase Ste14
MKSPYTLIAVAAWLVLFGVWLFGSAAGRRNPRAPDTNARLWLQIPASCLLVACFVLLFDVHLRGLRVPVTPPTALPGAIGAALALAGVGFASWARLTLGRNWSGLVMTVREGHELVQTGPYAIVRHPIYTGMLAAILGTTLTLGTLASWLAVPAGLAGILIRVEVEERLMEEKFGAAHAAYRLRTKKLIPWVW